MTEFVLSKQRLTRLIGHDKIKGKKHRSHLYCPVCNLQFKIGDRITIDGKVLVHSECMPLFRFDIPDTEVSDEELDNFFIIIDPYLPTKKHKLVIEQQSIP